CESGRVCETCTFAQPHTACSDDWCREGSNSRVGSRCQDCCSFVDSYSGPARLNPLQNSITDIPLDATLDQVASVDLSSDRRFVPRSLVLRPPGILRSLCPPRAPPA